jgi:hypothetical protein
MVMGVMGLLSVVDRGGKMFPLLYGISAPKTRI